MAAVETIELTKYFDEVCALDNVSLSIRDGELLVLVGPSGSGKTTLLRMIAGLDHPSSGVIRIDGRVVNNLAPNERKISMVFQSYALYPHMTVRHNIAFPLHNEHLPEHVVEERVVQTARLFNIDRFLNRKPRELSGGERQRVALARAMIRQPLVFLLDEPLSNLDVSLRSIARTELRLFQRKLAVTTIFVTHDQVDAMSMGDRIAVMADGRIRQIGIPQELYNRPADTFVASFLGSPPMNLVEADSCIVGFRPEHLHLHNDNNGPGDALIVPFQVERIEYLGSRLLLYGTVKSQSGPTNAVASLPASETRALVSGQSHNFIVERESVSYFNKHTQLRMSAPSQFGRDGVVIA